ncbi:MAG: GNAT family N-acetyltransferase [Defluviitaleaceae bacterium]|nr:GNAT family N-acetyltransferase [Defluviitaleaceae bacterium]
MIDNSVPYIEVVMRRDPGLPLPVCPLPEGFSYEMYQPGYEKEWARIEASVEEFECEMDALLHYQKEFLPCPEELPRRCIFIKAPDGELVGTATAWWAYHGQRRHPLVHWVAVKPAYQGKGLGKAITAEVVRLMTAIDGDSVFLLGTQTTSHKAIGIYEWAGFYITDEKNILGCANDRYDEAIALLESLRR